MAARGPWGPKEIYVSAPGPRAGFYGRVLRAGTYCTKQFVIPEYLATVVNGTEYGRRKKNVCIRLLLKNTRKPPKAMIFGGS